MNLALIGFGTVGQGLVEILHDKADDLHGAHGLDARVVAVCDAAKGTLYHENGLDTSALLTAVESAGSLNDYPDQRGLVRGWDSLTTIRESRADVIVEATWTDLETGEPAMTHIRTAFEAGKHVVTSNKGPAALAYRNLRAIADAHGVYWGIEGTVMSGTPTVRLARAGLAGCAISELRGILNGTTNFVLTQMETGASYQDALAEAQRLGYAEADPTADVEGHDALGKLLILAAAVMGTPMSADQVQRHGITGLTPEDMREARSRGKRWKLISAIRLVDGHTEASVGPQMLDVAHPLAGVTGATNAVTFTTDLLGEVTLVGPGAGRRETGFALLSDLIEIQRMCS